MSQPTFHETPRLGAVLREQVRAVALALRMPAMAALAVLVLGSGLAIGEFVTGGGAVDFAPELSMVPAFVGLLFPLAVWKGENRFGTSFLWLLPVDRRQHALAKVAAGWVCLMATVLFFLVWLFVLSLITGGNILGEHTVQLLPSTVIPDARTIDPAALRAVQYAPEPVFWLVPFTAATGTYLLASAVAVGVRYPIRWIIGMLLAILLVSALGAAAHIDWLRLMPSRLVEIVFEGRFGLDTLFTARAESLKTAVVLTTGKTVSAWHALPDVGDWVLATLLWLGVGLAALAIASLRQREKSSPTSHNTL